jgi:hypothetical protein
MARAGVSVAVCDMDHLSPPEMGSGTVLCSNWKAVLYSSVVALICRELHVSSSGFRANQFSISSVTFHLVWHLLFRLFHRTTLANRPTTPVDMWKTPLPRNYPIHPREKQEEEDKTSVALNETGTPLTESNTRRPYNPMLSPAASADDLEKGAEGDDASFVSSKSGKIAPPGLQRMVGSH